MTEPEQARPLPRFEASRLMHRPVRRRDGQPAGRVSDLVVQDDADGRPIVAAVMVTNGPWGRLLGYERPQRHGPWPLTLLAHLVIGRAIRTIPYDELHPEDLLPS
jgi:hypothetical protein